MILNIDLKCGARKGSYKNKMIDIEAEMIYLKEQVIGHVTS